MKILLLAGLLCITAVSPVRAQFAAQREAQYMATLKAVTDFKMDDDENIKNVEQLREDARFNRKLARMMERLQNTRTKDSRNRRIYKILLKAGEEIYRELD